MTGNHHELPTVSSTLAARYVAVLIWCKSCRHQGEADLQGLDAGRGDVPLVKLRWRCASCRSRLTDFVCTGRGAIGVKPWRTSEARPGDVSS